jgi:hypothetical protein
MMELAVRAFGLWRQDKHFKSSSSNLFRTVGKTAEILQLNYAEGESSLGAKNVSPKLLVLCTLCVHLQRSSDIPVAMKWHRKFPAKFSVMGEFTWIKVQDWKELMHGNELGLHGAEVLDLKGLIRDNKMGST